MKSEHYAWHLWAENEGTMLRYTLNIQKDIIIICNYS